MYRYQVTSLIAGQILGSVLISTSWIVSAEPNAIYCNAFGQVVWSVFVLSALYRHTKKKRKKELNGNV